MLDLRINFMINFKYFKPLKELGISIVNSGIKV